MRERDGIPPGEANRDRMRRVSSQLAVLRYRLAVDRPDGPPRAFAMGARERDEMIEERAAPAEVVETDSDGGRGGRHRHHEQETQ